MTPEAESLLDAMAFPVGEPITRSRATRLTRAIVTELGITDEMVESLRETWHMCADERCTNDRREAAEIFSTLLEVSRQP